MCAKPIRHDFQLNETNHKSLGMTRQGRGINPSETIVAFEFPNKHDTTELLYHGKMSLRKPFQGKPHSKSLSQRLHLDKTLDIPRHVSNCFAIEIGTFKGVPLKSRFQGV